MSFGAVGFLWAGFQVAEQSDEIFFTLKNYKNN